MHPKDDEFVNRIRTYQSESFERSGRANNGFLPDGDKSPETSDNTFRSSNENLRID